MGARRKAIYYLQMHPLTALLLGVLLLLLVAAVYTVWSNKSLVLYNNGIFFQNQGTYVKGQIVVTFEVQNYNDAVDVLSAFQRPYTLIQSESSGNVYVFIVDVPQGHEQEWIDKFQGVQGVISAHYANLK